MFANYKSLTMPITKSIETREHNDMTIIRETQIFLGEKNRSGGGTYKLHSIE